MKTIRLLVVVIATISFAVLALAQDGGRLTPSIANPADQARIKPLVEAETKAREALLAKTATLPESTAVKAAKEAYDKALANLNAAAEKLPEHQAWKESGARALDEAYRILAENKLSSREYRPELNAKGELVFIKIEAPK